MTAVLGLSCIGWLALCSGRSWLSRQPLYQVPFKDVQVVPAPPAWFRGGTAAFLESVRQRAGESETLPVLELTATQIKRSFLQSPWVEDVIRVSFPPRGLRVELSYRQPVAVVQITKGQEEYLVDESAMILPREDVDLDHIGSLIVIAGRGLCGPLNPRAGAVWEAPPGVHDVSGGNQEIASAARLAAFLTREMRDLGASRPANLDMQEINPMDPQPQSRGLFVFNKAQHCFLWGKAPGEESRSELTAEEKWAALCDWSKQTKNERLPGGDYWDFSSTGLVHVCTKESPKDPSSHPPSRDESHPGR
jgi:hypothetical protein